MTAPVKFFTDEKGKKMVQMTEAYYKKLSSQKKKEGTDKVIAGNKRGIADTKAGRISTAENSALDPNLIDTDKQCKQMKNEIRRKFNEKSEAKVEYII